jgi:LacI family transcriptional regulator
MEERTNGYLKAIDDAGLAKKIKQIPYDLEKTKCVEVIRKFLAGQKTIDAVFFSTNYLALSGIEAIRQLGLRIAEDIGIIVFDDNTNFELFSPSISAVAQPVKQIGEQVTQIMLNRLQANTQAGFERVVLKTTLIARESTVNQVPALVK